MYHQLGYCIVHLCGLTLNTDPVYGWSTQYNTHKTIERGQHLFLRYVAFRSHNLTEMNYQQIEVELNLTPLILFFFITSCTLFVRPQGYLKK